MNKPKPITRRVLISAAFLAPLAGCATSKQQILDSAATKSIKYWLVDFLYAPRKTENTVSDDKGTETKEITGGQSKRDLKLRDDIVFALKGSHGIDASRTKRPNSGEMKISAVDFDWGGFGSLTVELLSPKGEVIGRVQVKNGTRNATVKNDEDFAEYSAAVIAATIKGEKFDG